VANNFEITLDPDAWVPPSSNHADRGCDDQGRIYLAFDCGAATDEYMYSKAFRWPDEYTGSGALKADICYYMASATSDDIEFEVYMEAISDGDSIDMDGASSFDSANTVNPTVPGTGQYPDICTATLSNKDSVASGDYVRLKLALDASDSAATGDCNVLWVCVYEEEAA